MSGIRIPTVFDKLLPFQVNQLMKSDQEAAEGKILQEQQKEVQLESIIILLTPSISETSLL